MPLLVLNGESGVDKGVSGTLGDTVGGVTQTYTWQGIVFIVDAAQRRRSRKVFSNAKTTA